MIPSASTVPAAPAAAISPWGGRSNDRCDDDTAWYGFLDVKGSDGNIAQSRSEKINNNASSDDEMISSKINNGRNFSSAPDAAASIADTVSGSGGGGDQNYVGSLAQDGVDNDWGSWGGRTTSRSPVISPGLTPLRGRSRRGWWRRRRDKFPVET